MTDVLFITTMEGVPWGGSEELWSQSAAMLASRGYAIQANVKHWQHPARQLAELEAHGVKVVQRGKPEPTRTYAVRLLRRIRRFFRPRAGYDYTSILSHIILAQPRLLVLSNGSHLPAEGIIGDILESRVPYVNICQANREDFFIEDKSLMAVREYTKSAQEMLFVSKANANLFERQVGMRMQNAYIVRNPYAVQFAGESHAHRTWSRDTVNFAIVARLHPPSKGHDIALAVLGRPEWRNRSWKLSLFGEGAFADLIMEIAAMYGIAGRVVLRGHVSNIDEIWRENEVLLLPSRYEGMPLALVEAMLCGRVAVTNDVGGASELIEDDVCGYLSRSADIESFRDALERAWSARQNWAAVGAQAASRVRELVGPNPVGAFVERVEKLLKASRREDNFESTNQES